GVREHGARGEQERTPLAAEHRALRRREPGKELRTDYGVDAVAAIEHLVACLAEHDQREIETGYVFGARHANGGSPCRALRGRRAFEREIELLEILGEWNGVLAVERRRRAPRALDGRRERAGRGAAGAERR